jgi:hypothetical protein
MNMSDPEASSPAELLETAKAEFAEAIPTYLKGGERRYLKSNRDPAKQKLIQLGTTIALTDEDPRNILNTLMLEFRNQAKSLNWDETYHAAGHAELILNDIFKNVLDALEKNHNKPSDEAINFATDHYWESARKATYMQIAMELETKFAHFLRAHSEQSDPEPHRRAILNWLTIIGLTSINGALSILMEFDEARKKFGHFKWTDEDALRVLYELKGEVLTKLINLYQSEIEPMDAETTVTKTVGETSEAALEAVEVPE